MSKVKKPKKINSKFPKSFTGIPGLDDITNGGLPKHRSTLLLGNTGCGKTIMAMEFLVNGIVQFNEPGVFMSFEEKADDLVQNVNSLGYDLTALLAAKKVYLEHVQIRPDEIQKTGQYDLEGLFVRLEHAINRVKARRIVLDSLDTLFYGLDHNILRSEFKRLISWLSEKNVTSIITAEIGDTFLSQHGLEEYVADCVIQLDNRVKDQITTRRLRIVKYRGSTHGDNEYPSEIDEKGITVYPTVASKALELKVSSKRISSGNKYVDEMLDNSGFYAGSSILISGTAGTGKTSMTATFAHAVCKSGERCFFCAFEEAPNQIIRNMRSIGVNLNPAVNSGLLQFYYSRPTLQNLELHFIAIKKIIAEFKPAVVILDPVTNLMTEGPNSDIRTMLTRFVDYLKLEQITVMFTAAITVGSIMQNPSDEGISSMVDTWLMVEDIKTEGERNRSFSVVKSRGMAHSNQSREFSISAKGITLMPIVRSGEKILTGSKRRTKETENQPKEWIGIKTNGTGKVK
jgi:circadian clock protein KaiC